MQQGRNTGRLIASIRNSQDQSAGPPPRQHYRATGAVVHRRARQSACTHLHHRQRRTPGIVRTQMMLKAPGFFRVVSYTAPPFSLSAVQAAVTQVFSPRFQRWPTCPAGTFRVSS